MWAEGFGWADLEKRVPVAPETRFRIGTASTALTSAAVGLLLEKDRLKLDDEIQAYVPAFPKKQWPVTLRQVMGHLAGVTSDGGDEGPLFGEHCGRPVDALQHFAAGVAAVRAGDRVPLFALRLDPGERGGRSRREGAVPHVHARARLRAAGHGRHDEPIPRRSRPRGTATSYFPRFAANPRYGPDVMRERRLLVLRGIQRVPVHPVRPGPLRDGHRQRQAAAALDRPIAPDVAAAAFGTGDGLRPWLGPRDRRAVGEGDARGRPRRGLCWAGWRRP